MRTLVELSDGLASNAFGTHLGYGVALGLRLHWIAVQAEQDLSGLGGEKAEEEAAEWAERQRLSHALQHALTLAPDDSSAAVRELLDPYWGFGSTLESKKLAHLLRWHAQGRD